MFLDRRQRLATIGAFADEFDLRFVFEQFSKTLASKRFIVDNQGADLHRECNLAVLGEGFSKIVTVLKIFFLHSTLLQVEARFYHVEEYFPEVFS
jgi:hypothetical protein